MSTNVTDPVFDPAAVYPAVAAAEAGLRDGEWSAVRAAFGSAPSSYERHLIVAGARRVDGCEALLAFVLERDPGDLLAATMLAAREVQLGWTIRGSGRASTVTPAQIDGFHAHLCRAEQLLITVCARDPGFAPAWCVRLDTARGLELGTIESQRRYDRLSRCSPHDLMAQRTVLQDLLPKWGGSWADAHRFAWACANSAAPGSPNASVVIDYHLERWVDSDQSAAAVFADPRLRQEIWQAGELSVMNPAFAGAPGWEYALSQFALGYSLAEDWPRARSCFSRLGPYASEWGWDYLHEDPAKAFKQQRATAMRQG